MNLAPSLAVGLFIAVWPVVAATQRHTGPVGILSALPEEMQLLARCLKNTQTKSFLSVEFRVGTVDGHKVVLATTGIGKVNAAKTTSLLLDRFKPRYVIFSGVAGGLNPDLAPGDIVVGSRVAQHDFGKLTDSGFELQTPAREIPIFIETPPHLLQAADKAATTVRFDPLVTTRGTRSPRVLRGTIVTGDTFVASAKKASELRQTLNADAVEMEGAAVALVCYQQMVPCIVVRSISDKADDAAWEDFERFIKMAASNSAKFTLELLKAADTKPRKSLASPTAPARQPAH